ncbi:uncharacterized protein LOC134663128 [Cydia amplana]|uniref:uncharacterized protein LOC134663128 n=1 Tax=Cydia amplana TaxID=1869771 RepID=UPI002FE681D1
MSDEKLSGSAPDLSSENPAHEERMIANRRKRGHNDEFTEAFAQFTSQIKTMMKDWKVEFTQETSQINDKLNKLQDSSQELNDQYDAVAKKLEDQSKEIKAISTMNAEITELKKQNMKLLSDFNSNEQRDRLLNIEIVGVPETNNEDLTGVILKLGECTEVHLTIADIIQVNRVTPKLKIQGRPRNIIAKLRMRQLKDNIISQARKCRLSTKDLDIQGKVYPTNSMGS